MSTSQKLTTPEVLEKALREAPPRRFLLDLDDFNREELQLVIDTAKAMKEVLDRDIKKVPTLRGKMVVTLFFESSTRTRISFEEAGKVLSADVINMSSVGSSADKGESLLNTALTLEAMGADIIVMRHPNSGAPYFMASHLSNVSLINAGDGMHAHPTQALLDLFTIQESLGKIEGKKVVIVGDILHSRVARSNLWGLTTAGAKVVLCGPPTLLPLDMLNSNTWKKNNLSNMDIETDLDKALDNADVVMALRLQVERQGLMDVPSLREYSTLWQVNSQRISHAKPDVIVMHPGPMNEGVEISQELAHGSASVIQRQVANGVAIRMALLYLMSGPQA